MILNPPEVSKEAKKHLLEGGRCLLKDLSREVEMVVDLDLICKTQNIPQLDPKNRTELIRWPDGVEVPVEDFHPEEWAHKSDDYEKITDFDEDTKYELIKAIDRYGTVFQEPLQPLPSPTLTPVAPSKTETTALCGLPKTEPVGQMTKKKITELAEEEASMENEAIHRAAKAELARDAVAQNQPPVHEFHHLPAYREAAKTKILASTESAETLNLRLQALKIELEKALKERTITYVTPQGILDTLKSLRSQITIALPKPAAPAPSQEEPQP